jgi:putative transposase
VLKNRRLARHIAGVGMGEFRRQLGYKGTWPGGRLHVVDRWYPSSTTCSACGAVKTTLRLAERTYRCDQCGLVADRDPGAARNLAPLVDEVSGRHVLPELLWATVNQARWKLTQDPHHAGSGYRHGKTHTHRCGSTPARQRTDPEHVLTRFLNGPHA